MTLNYKRTTKFNLSLLRYSILRNTPFRLSKLSLSRSNRSYLNLFLKKLRSRFNLMFFRVYRSCVKLIDNRSTTLPYLKCFSLLERGWSVLGSDESNPTNLNFNSYPKHSDFNRFFSFSSLPFQTKTQPNYVNLSYMYFMDILNYYRYYYHYSFNNFLNVCSSRSPHFDKVLFLNFRRFRFYPSIQNLDNHVYSTVSLGMFSKYLRKGKAFIKNKLVYMIVSGFFRKLLLYSGIFNLILLTKRTPIYFREIMSTINTPVITIYKHPFLNHNVDESLINRSFLFSMFIFTHSKSYSYMKPRKKGRIKRKITKRIVKLNNLVD